MHFSAGGAGANANLDGSYNLNDEGQKMFLNAVNYMLGPKPVYAWNLQPTDSNTVTTTSIDLTWNAGAYAAAVNGHHVYFGDNLNDVKNGTGGTDKGLQTGTTYTVSNLVKGMTYYWRIDEVNDPNIWRGSIWRFLVKPVKAWNPDPYDGEVYVSTSPTLSWNAGLNSTASKVYLGTDANTLVLETTVTHTVGVERYSYTKTGLSNNQKYFWRVNQVPQTGPTVTGDVWSFTTMPYIPITDPNLVGWWKFDDGKGAKALDSSGYNHHGAISGNPQWGAGHIEDGNALNFDGDGDYVTITGLSEIQNKPGITICMWVKADLADPYDVMWFTGGTGTIRCRA